MIEATQDDLITPTGARSRLIVQMRVDALTYDQAAEAIVGWAERRESRYVCIATVHMAMEARDDPAFRRLVNRADMVTSDGMPLVWGLRLLGVPHAGRVYGPDLTLAICSLAARRGVPVAFVGGTEHTLTQLERELQRRFPRLQISLVQSPPFRATNPPEDAELVRRIATSGAGIVFVGLGCPKQERWMAEHKGRVPAVMVGVGAAFDFLAGTKPQAPRWMMRWGLEWLFRLSAEPRRLWRRYLYNNPRFVALFALQVAGTWGRIVRDRRGRAPKRPSAVSAREPSS